MGRKRRGRAIDGWLVLDKAAGKTSASAVADVRRILDARKAGHGGTLDPIATGVLPIALGEATKAISFVLEGDKQYAFSLRWGEGRDTDDIEGRITETSDRRPGAEAIRALIEERFLGWIEQVPPAYSALKVNGRRAYELARRGDPVALAPREVRIERLELIALPDADHAAFELTCGKGTYVRALVRDLAHALGTCGHVTALRRTRAGPFSEQGALTLEQLTDLGHIATPLNALLSVETALADIPALALTESQANRLKNGQKVRVLHAENGTVCAMAAGKPVAVAEVEEGEVRPVRVFNL